MFELLAPVLETSVVVERDAALPVVRGLVRHQFDELVEVGDGFLEVAQAEVRFATPLIHEGRLGIELEAGVIIGDGPGEFARFLVRSSAQKPWAKILWIGGNGLTRQLDSLAVILFLQRVIGGAQEFGDIGGCRRVKGERRRRDKTGDGANPRKERAKGAEGKNHGPTTTKPKERVNGADNGADNGETSHCPLYGVDWRLTRPLWFVPR